MTREMLWMDSQRRSAIYGNWTQRLWWRQKIKTDRNLASKASVKSKFQAQPEHKLIVALNKPLSLSGLLVLSCKIAINMSALSCLPLGTVKGIGRDTTYENPLTAMKYSEKESITVKKSFFFFFECLFLHLFSRHFGVRWLLHQPAHAA